MKDKTIQAYKELIESECCEFLYIVKANKYGDLKVHYIKDGIEYSTFCKDWKYKGIRGWLSKKTSRLDCPEESGIYRFKDDDENIVYIGKTCNLRQRMSQHKSRPAKWEEHYKIEYACMSHADMHIMEPFLVVKYKPIHNKEFMCEGVSSSSIEEPGWLEL